MLSISNLWNYSIGEHNQPSQESSDHALLAGKLCLLAHANSKSNWLMDSGATDHVCSDLSNISTYKPVHGGNEFIVVPDGRQVPIMQGGL